MRTLDRWIDKYNLIVYKPSRRVLIPESSIIQLLEKRDMTPIERNNLIKGIYGDHHGYNKKTKQKKRRSISNRIY